MLLAQNELGKIVPPSQITPGVEGLNVFIRNVITIIVFGAGIAAFIFLIIGGLQWIVSGGEPKAAQAAKGRVTAALIGLAIVISSFAIIRLVEYFFNVKIISGGIAVPLP